ncbi:N alpha-acetyl-transferase [Lithohypha guttulata]|uniref:N-alpha-acetyltransferase 40 n=1 Tax=Lithohypha guttulata TaxID=1690604 RepID=A0AAN7SVM7_9EURO|nr:N alpha-acetyl-transferase [Lithohypha guttulata]
MTCTQRSNKALTRAIAEEHQIAEARKDVLEKTGRALHLDLHFSASLRVDKEHILSACFELIQESSAADYKASEIKWSPSSKQKEMLLLDMRYLILSGEDKAFEPNCKSDEAILGFVSFMITYEDGHEVIYVYEIHLAKELRGQGVGKVLMELVERIGSKIKVEKCMLTVFKSNKQAVRWYERLGYDVDVFSPGPRLLRNGTVKEPGYLILSKSFDQDDD